ncbi:MAG: TVP38/TMEM64 family protein [Mycobacteriaceae bacterium]
MRTRRLDRPLAVRLTVLAVFVVVVIVLALVIDLPSVDELRRQYSGTGLLGAVGFSVVYALLSLLPLPATVFTIAAGAVFGLSRGVPIVVLGASLGAVLAFYLGRLLGRDVVQRFTGARVETLDALLARRGFWAVLTARLIPIVPFIALNYLSGLTALRMSAYLPATVLGILPATVAYVAVGAYGTEPGSWPFLTALGALVLLTLGGVLANRVRRRRGAQSARRAGSAPDPAPAERGEHRGGAVGETAV